MHGKTALGRIAGVEVNADWTLAVTVAAIVLFLTTGASPSFQSQLKPAVELLAACGAAVLFLVSVLAHELAQAIVARRSGAAILSLTLFGFGGIPYTGLAPAPAATELRMAVAGPIVSLLLGMLCLALASADASAGSAILMSVGWMNIALCAVSLLPGYPLAAGRALRAILWVASADHHRATWLACRIGHALGCAAILCGIALCFGVSVPVLSRAGFIGPWLMLAGWFLSRAARASYRNQLIVDVHGALAALEDLTYVAVSNVMRDVQTRMHPRDVVRDLRERIPALVEQPLLPIEADGVFLGWVRREDFAGCDFAGRGEQQLAELMIPVTYLPTVRPEQTIGEAVALMNRSCLDHVAVVRQRRLLGTVSREDVITWMCRGG